MSLEFPPCEDVRLGKSPLTEVICQIRFDPILSIAEIPAGFQDQVRGRFPKFEWEQPITMQVPDPQSESGSISVQVAPRTSKFSTASGDSTISLATNFAALSTSGYTVWEDFAHDVQLMLAAVQTVYGPLSIVRVGLRYLNVLSAVKLGLAGWHELLDLVNPSLFTPLGTTPWRDFNTYQSALVIDDDENTLAFRFGSQEDADGANVLLDLDYFRESAIASDINLVSLLEGFHQRIYLAFRWSIREGRLDVFEPAQ